jgi:hypothetical protein
MSVVEFVVAADAKAQEWLDAHPSVTPRVIAYDVHRCCGGGRICNIQVRALRTADALGGFALGTGPDGNRFLIDRRAARRLPRNITLTVRGLGPLKHLDLVLSGDQWGELLYT